LLLDLARRLEGPISQAQAISRARVAPDLNALRDQMLGIVDARDQA
jgi:hypothetical protein